MRGSLSGSIFQVIIFHKLSLTHYFGRKTSGIIHTSRSYDVIIILLEVLAKCSLFTVQVVLGCALAVWEEHGESKQFNNGWKFTIKLYKATVDSGLPLFSKLPTISTQEHVCPLL